MVSTELQIPENFFKPEERSGFQVTRERKELWAIELDLLYKFDEVCKKYGLKYCVGAGTMLGAVRHKGFIPWDDDIDLYMLRKDYDILMDHANEFEYPYFLQNSVTEKNLLRTYTRLRNSRTTGTTKMDEYRLIDKGLFIDICPIDGISDNKWNDKRQYYINKLQRKLFECYNASRTPAHKESLSRKLKLPLKKILAGMFVRNKDAFYRSFESNLKKYSTEGTKLWGNRSLTFECPRTRRLYEEWKDLIYMPFEFIEVPVPRNYDSMLRQQYGDYMKIPEKKGENMHGDLIVSTDYPYDELKGAAK